MKTILITGANGALGTVTVKKFLEAGYKVIAVDAADNNLGFAKNNEHFELHGVNLSDEPAATSFTNEMISKHGAIDGALMLVGGFAMGGIDKTGGQELHKMYSLNFETAYYIARPLFAHMMEKQYGRLVFIGARPALVPQAGKGMVAYALSKSLLFKLAELLNAQAGNKNVVASVVVPSTIDTKPNRDSMPDADPSNWVTPGQVADVLEFICGEKGMPLRESVYKVYNNA
jgi:NAD(P)-dependent dehydrogenase (short-subunit alcohol dehydrogenase family)